MAALKTFLASTLVLASSAFAAPAFGGELETRVLNELIAKQNEIYAGETPEIDQDMVMTPVADILKYGFEPQRMQTFLETKQDVSVRLNFDEGVVTRTVSFRCTKVTGDIHRCRLVDWASAVEGDVLEKYLGETWLSVEVSTTGGRIDFNWAAWSGSR